jgi:hypothetical protein
LTEEILIRLRRTDFDNTYGQYWLDCFTVEITNGLEVRVHPDEELVWRHKNLPIEEINKRVFKRRRIEKLKPFRQSRESEPLPDYINLQEYNVNE